MKRTSRSYAIRCFWIELLILLLMHFIVRIVDAQSEAPIEIRHTTGEIKIDGDLSDPGWKDAARVDKFYETVPGDNAEPKMKTIGYVTFDNDALYVALDCFDPDPSKIRAPYMDRDNMIFDSDYAGVLLDTRHDRRTALKLLTNARGIQEDSIEDDSNGSEDTSIDLFWDSAGKITDHGYSLEMRIPFSSLRFKGSGPQIWGITFYRNSNRDTRYRFFSSRQPRSSNCEICHERDLIGLEGLPAAGHITVAPYGSLSQKTEPSSARDQAVDWNGGADAKWVMNADTTIDATVNPDFSQVEADVAQISVNNRFALFFPEKRPFFLEALDLFSTPIRAVNTRAITSPVWGVRGTGKFGTTAYTLLATEDRGGGSAIIPGAQSSTFVDQDFHSLEMIGRARHDLGRSFVSFLMTDRESQSNGFNRVIGPDFQWSPDDSNRITGQFLESSSQTPNLPALDPTWDARSLLGHAAFASWNHSSRRLDWNLEYDDLSDEFRADNGFVPQVGYRRGLARTSFKLYTSGFFTRFTPLMAEDYSLDTDGNTLRQRFFPGIQFEGKKSLFGEVDYVVSTERVNDIEIPRHLVTIYTEVVPSRRFGLININAEFGDEIDYANVRLGHGGSLSITSRIQATNHLELKLSEAFSWLSVDADQTSRRLFTAGVHRMKATYNLTSRTFFRGIIEYVGTKRDPSLYIDPSTLKHEADLNSSALFGFKLNWQTTLFVGYGDERIENDRFDLVPGNRQLFVKFSYALQH